MSPEQLAKRKLDTRSDIFSFGLTMYELFAGKHACPGEGRERLRQLRSSSFRFEPPSKLNPETPPALDKIILKALRRRPESRYQSVTELLLDLSRMGESRI
jgi:serine/threonine-protein kinase